MTDVVVGIVEKDKKILMIKRVKQDDGLIWAFPGGKVENGETKDSACIREIKEETGITVQVIKVIGERIHPNTQVKITYFLCEYLAGEINALKTKEILDIAYKDKKTFLREVKTDIYGPVLKYVEENIK